MDDELDRLIGVSRPLQVIDARLALAAQQVFRAAAPRIRRRHPAWLGAFGLVGLLALTGTGAAFASQPIPTDGPHASASHATTSRTLTVGDPAPIVTFDWVDEPRSIPPASTPTTQTPTPGSCSVGVALLPGHITDTERDRASLAAAAIWLRGADYASIQRTVSVEVLPTTGTDDPAVETLLRQRALVEARAALMSTVTEDLGAYLGSRGLDANAVAVTGTDTCGE